MGNLGGGELLVILMLGLLVLGPSRLAVVVQQIGRLVGQVRRLAAGFQEEFREIIEDPTLEAAARARGAAIPAPEQASESDSPGVDEPGHVDGAAHEDDSRGASSDA
ncbi:MAG: hypothetical protein VX219_05010 [Actinomycetota bacterium]|nr:hypothetical protein [Actinomycetota bacterium]